MTKRTNKATRYTPAAAPPPPRNNSSDSENSDTEDRSHSRTSTSSVEEEVKANGNGTHPTTAHTYSSGSSTPVKETKTASSDAKGGFLTRVTSLPVVKDSFSTLTSYAEGNKYSKYALDTAGSAVTTANKYTEGYQSRILPLLQTPISTVDKLANKSLDIVENTFPIVTKPTAEIVTQVKKPIVYVEESSKNAYTQLQSTIDARVTVPVKTVTSSIASTAASTRDAVTTRATQTRDAVTARATSTANTIATTAAQTRETVTARATSTANTVVSTATQARDTVTARATSTANTIVSTATSTRDNVTARATSTATAIATQVNTRATPLVDGLENVVNRYLPAETDGEKTAGQTNQASRVVDLGRSASLRVTRRVGARVAPITAPITKTVYEYRDAAEKNVYVVKSKDQLHSLNGRLSSLLESLRVHAKELKENVEKVPAQASSSVHTRVNVLSSKVLAEIDSLSVYLKEHSPSLPQSVQTRLQPLLNFVNDRYVVVRGEIVKTDVGAVQKARNILHLTTVETLPILQNAAHDVRETLVSYQVSAQEQLHKGLTKVQEVNSAVHVAAYRAVHSVHVILVGK
ncbi:hypothetical protein CPC16_005634 [Podila verticillata]|nr:hypothetical protein BGZ52_003673 [Haplosporangium bisporale]KAF9212941.1 hypothetical protein BGZ59_006125 [Podila verticillata]KAF9389684.1 hypothetical protein CPC16_005634 [Podila verticillata]KFH66258.1 hypothetical protein MVEG_08358 [Podila verticillata NRRL 6337]